MMPSSVPQNWNKAPLGDVCELVNGRAFRPTEWSTKGLPIIRIQNLRDARAPYNHFEGAVDEKHLVNKGDLLFAWSGTPGTSFGAHIWSGERAVLNQHIFKLNFAGELFRPRFLQLVINPQLPQLIRKAKGGAGLKHLNKGTVEAIVVPVPPRAEQDRIVKLLGATIGRLDQVSAELVGLSDMSAELVSAVLAAAIDGRLLSTGAVEGAERANPESGLPSHWSVVAVREAGEITLGRQRSPVHHFGPNMRPYLRVANVLEDRIDTSDVMTMNFTDEEFKRYKLKVGDILLERILIILDRSRTS